MKKLLSAFVNWFEGGELAPLIILVSIPHYAGVLARFDFWPVAAALGFLLDLGHYRTIRAYQRGQGALWMIVLTIFSFGFHSAFYFEGGAGLASLFFGASVPVVIFALSFLSVAERWTQKAHKAAQNATDAPALRADAPQTASIAAQAAPASIAPPATMPVMRPCKQCAAQFDSAGKLAAHVRWQHAAHLESHAPYPAPPASDAA